MCTFRSQDFISNNDNIDWRAYANDSSSFIPNEMYLIYDLPYFMLAHGIFVAEKKIAIGRFCFCAWLHFVFVSDARSRFFVLFRSL